MSISIYGEIALDWLVGQNSKIEFRRGGAGLYAALCTSRLGMKTDLLTVLGPDINEYYLSVWNSIGISLEYAKKDENYSIPRYLTTGFENYAKKVSRPMSEIKYKYKYSPNLPLDSEGLLLFPMNHSIPESICVDAKKRNIPIFLDPKPNKESISDAKRLLKYVDVLLVNEEELLLISNKKNTSEAIEVLLNEGPKYIVVKRGVKGCIVAEKGKSKHIIPAYRSEAICTLGSGDAFGGALAATFIETGDMKYSVKFASCMAACFIEQFEVEYIPNKKAIEHYMVNRETLDCGLSKELKIYLAGPFFSQLELSWIEYVSEFLRNSGLEILSPSEENGFINPDMSLNDRKRIFHSDLELLQKADIVVALIDNNDPGTNFEIGYAFSKGKPVIGLKTSKGQLNNMILFGCSRICNTIDEVISEVHKYGTK